MWTVLLATSLAIAAQAPGTDFAFSGESLLIDLRAAAALRVDVRDGAPGRVKIDDLTPQPAAAFSLAGARLVIGHHSESPGHFRIEAPPAARLKLRVNGVEVASLEPGAGRVLVWRSGAPASETLGARESVRRSEDEGAKDPAGAFRIHAFAGPLVVDSIDIVNPEHARVLRLRVGRRDFRVSADRSVRFGFHSPTRWGVLTVADTAARVDIELPTGTRLFRLRVAGEPIWILHSAGARALCEPVARVSRPDGGEDWVFDLEAGLVCRREGGAQPA